MQPSERVVDTANLTHRLRTAESTPKPDTNNPKTTPLQPQMPPRLRSSLKKSVACPVDGRGAFFCPSCATWRRTLTSRANAVSRRGDRLPSLLASNRRLTTSSVINAGRNVPPRFKGLYEALDSVGSTAAGQVNLSRLQLALRGMESEEPLMRVAGKSWVLLLDWIV